MRKRTKLAVVLAGTMAAVLTVTGMASAATYFLAGSGSSTPRDMASDVAWLSPTSAAWFDVPTTSISVVVPAGTNRRVRSHFQAESLCQNTSWCSTRAVWVKSGVVGELLPAANTDFAFDSPGGSWESASMLRSSGWLSAGTYTVKVQARLVGPAGGAQFRLDDYTHRLDLVHP